MAKSATKRGPGRPKKIHLVEKSAPKKRGRKPGIKNKSFLEKVSIQADALEGAIGALEVTLNDASFESTNTELTEAAGIVSGLKESLSDALAHLGNLPAEFAPGKQASAPLAWEKGAFVVFTHETLKAVMHDAYEVLEVINLGKGPGNGTMVRIEKGMFPKSQLELIDGSTLEAAAEPHIETIVPSPRETVGRNKKQNGVVVPIPVAEQVEMSDDLNA